MFWTKQNHVIYAYKNIIKFISVVKIQIKSYAQRYTIQICMIYILLYLYKKYTILT
jgi:hypothetical protein